MKLDFASIRTVLMASLLSSSLQAAEISVEAAAMAMKALAEVQPRSLKDQVEYCGSVILRNGKLKVLGPAKGDFESCEPPQLGRTDSYLASFHTHGEFSWDSPTEIPSDEDFQGVKEEGVTGFIGTPGGRVWQLDPISGIASQRFCLGFKLCLTKSKRKDPFSDLSIPLSLTRDEANQLLQGLK